MILLASGNAHKLQEISQILGVTLRGLSEVPDAPDVVEDGDTFEANALKKGASLAIHTGSWALADDSGLEVDALHGAPGIYSARFAGEHGNDAANNALLLEKLKNVQNRRARFVCVLALCGPEGEAHTVRGVCEGRIAHAPSGESGFGYDPLFIPDGFDQSFAELGEEIKQTHSHRAKALAKMKKELGNHPAFSGSST